LLDERENLDGLAGRGSELLQFILFDQNVLAVLIFVALDDFGTVHNKIASRTEERLLDAGVTGVVELVQKRSLAARRRVKTHRNREQSE
jgi:hypothetical protein